MLNCWTLTCYCIMSRQDHDGSSIARTHEQALTALQLGAATACNGNGNDSKSSSSSTPNTTADIELHVDCFP
jgi:hypothetical protein